MQQQQIRISKNDPALAHALAAKVCDYTYERQGRAIEKQNKPSGKYNPLKATIRAFGADLVSSVVKRPNGTRADWTLFGLAAGKPGVALMLIHQSQARGVQENEVAIFTSHAVARAMQRTLGKADWASVRELLRPYALAVTSSAPFAQVMVSQAPMPSVSIVTPQGAFLGEREVGQPLILKTYVDREQFHAEQRLHIPSKEAIATIVWSTTKE